MTELQEKNLNYNWHPYTQHKIASTPIVITKGKDASIFDEHGNEFIDGISSWWCNPHGHSNKIIAEAIYKQASTLEHVLFGGFTHDKAIELSEKILEQLPDNQSKIFYSDNGSTAVEVGLKMCLQYFINKNIVKDTFIAFDEAFHGDTFGAMATSGITLFTDAFKDNMINVERIPLPTNENIEVLCEQFKNIIQKNKVAGFIFEPLIQGAAGMRMYSEKHLDRLIKICKENQVFTIADEVMTGFYKTGKLFASDYLKETPDIFCISKALTAGFVPLSITSCKQEIYDGFYENDINKSFFHGHTFMANPIGCAAALASLEITLSEATKNNVKRINTSHIKFSKELIKTNKVNNLRIKGIIIAFDVITKGDTDYYGEIRNLMYNYFIENKLILRPIGNTIYVLPPYCITDNQLDKIYKTILNLLAEHF